MSFGVPSMQPATNQQQGVGNDWTLTESPASSWFQFVFQNVAKAFVTAAGQVIATTGLYPANSGGPNITAGAGAPAANVPRGSLYLRTDGAAGTTLYVSQGGGAWAPVAGV